MGIKCFPQPSPESKTSPSACTRGDFQVHVTQTQPRWGRAHSFRDKSDSKEVEVGNGIPALIVFSRGPNKLRPTPMSEKGSNQFKRDPNKSKQNVSPDWHGGTGVPQSYEAAPLWDPTLGIYPGRYGGSMGGGAVSYERGTPVRKVSLHSPPLRPRPLDFTRFMRPLLTPTKPPCDATPPPPYRVVVRTHAHSSRHSFCTKRGRGANAPRLGLFATQ